MDVRKISALVLLALLLYAGFLLLPLHALAAGSCAAVEPRISWITTDVHWRSYADYQDRLLSVVFQFSSTDGAHGLAVLGAENTDDVTLASGMPIVLGDLGPGETVPATIEYRIPGETPRFRTSIYTTARDDCGNSYFFPEPRSISASYSISTRDSAQGQAIVDIDWDPAHDTDIDAVATVKYRIYPAYPSMGGQQEYVVAGSTAHSGIRDSVVINNLLPGRYYDFAVEVRDVSGVIGTQPQVNSEVHLSDHRFVFTNILDNPNPGQYDEVRVRDYYNGTLFWYSAMSLWETGFGYEYMFRDGANYRYIANRGKAAWQSAVDRRSNRIYLAGEMPRPEGDHHYRAMIGMLDENTNVLSTYLIPFTDDCNELIGVALDTSGNRLLAGERSPGTPLRSSPWPDGGGLWSIPLDTINQPATYARVYQDPLNRTWDKMAVFNGRLYATLHNGGYGVLYSAALTDVPASGRMSAAAWRIELSPGIFSLLVSDYHGLVAAQERAGDFLTLNINDGSGWRTVTSNYAFVGEGLYELSDHRFLAVRDNDGRSHHVGVAGINGDWEYLGTYAGGWPSYDYAQSADSIFYGTATPGKVWKLTYAP